MLKLYCKGKNLCRITYIYVLVDPNFGAEISAGKQGHKHDEDFRQ